MNLNRMMFRSLSILSRCCITIHQKIPLGHLGAEPQPPWGGSWRVAPNSRCRSWHFRRGPPASCGHGLRMLTKHVGMWHGKYGHYRIHRIIIYIIIKYNSMRIEVLRNQKPTWWISAHQMRIVAFFEEMIPRVESLSPCNCWSVGSSSFPAIGRFRTPLLATSWKKSWRLWMLLVRLLSM